MAGVELRRRFGGGEGACREEGARVCCGGLVAVKRQKPQGFADFALRYIVRHCAGTISGGGE